MFIQATSRNSSEIANGPNADGYDNDYDDDNYEDDDDDDDDDDEARKKQERAAKEELQRREREAREARQLLKRSRPVYEEYMPTSPAPSCSDSEISNREQVNVGESEPEDSDSETKKLRLLIQQEIEQRVRGGEKKKKAHLSEPPPSDRKVKIKTSKELLKEVAAAGKVDSKSKPSGQSGFSGKHKKQLASCLKQCQQLTARIQNLTNENA